ncbi:hypothetical protein GS444_20405 [Rhodococcus hoagii]|nr:hypothetical protein [Prescottella equi]
MSALVERDDRQAPASRSATCAHSTRTRQAMQREERGPGAAGIEDMQAGAVESGDLSSLMRSG